MKKLFEKKRVIFLWALALLVLLLFLFRHSLFQFSVETVLNFKTPGKKWKFEYEKVALKKGRISFGGITLETKEAFAECAIKRADLTLKHRRGLRFDMGLKIDSPLISIKSEAGGGFSFLDYLQSPFSHLKLDVSDAEVLFLGDDDPTKVFFSLVSDEERRALGTFYLSDQPLNQEAPPVTMKLFEWPEEWIVEFEFGDASLRWMNLLSKLSSESEFGKWNISNGVLGGHLWLGIAKAGSISQANATLRVTDTHGEHAENGICADIESLIIDTSYPSGKKADLFWQNFSLKFDVKGGKLACRDEKANIDFALCDVSGHLNFHSFKDSEILLKGYLDHKDQMTPVVLSANPSSVEKDTLDVDLRLSEVNLSTHLNLAIAREGDDLCVVRGRLKEMDAPQLAMLQHAASFFSPQIKSFQLAKGKVTSELSLRIVKGKVGPARWHSR